LTGSSICRYGRQRSRLDLGMLSGGNQQKVGPREKWLTYPPKLLVLCEPTRGMDVGAKSDVINIVRDLRSRGLAIIVISTEPENRPFAGRSHSSSSSRGAGWCANLRTRWSARTASSRAA